MNSIWQMWSGTLDSSTCDKIIEECDTYIPADTNLGFYGDSQLSDYRSSEISWIDKRDPKSSFIADILWDYAQEANKNAFGFIADYIKDIQYTKYHADENGHYDWHFDTFWGNPTAYDRKLSVVVQLSDPGDYEGGEFEIDPQYEPPNAEHLKTRGTVIVFPSFIRHRVTPVTRGTRKSLVTWIQGPKFR